MVLALYTLLLSVSKWDSSYSFSIGYNDRSCVCNKHNLMYRQHSKSTTSSTLSLSKENNNSSSFQQHQLQDDISLSSSEINSSNVKHILQQQPTNNSNSRRQILKHASSIIVSGALAASTISSYPTAANAFEKQFPESLEFDGKADLNAVRINRIELKKEAQAKKKVQLKTPSTEEDIETELFSYGSIVWGGALWFLSGSRSNPLITPLANILYNEKEEEWLKDRNEGLFASLPKDYYFILCFVFLAFGSITDVIVRIIAEDSGISLQLAGVSLIGGGALELGRIFSGEKRVTREYYNNEMMVQKEFADFAEQRLKPGGNCHRSEVVKAFRRFYAKYRQIDNNSNELDALSDLEVERLFRLWSQNTMGINMSSAGFFSGVQINADADVFANRT